MKNFLKVLLIILIIIVITVAIAMLVVTNQSKVEEIRFGEESIPTLYSVLGEERKLSSFNSGVESGINMKTLRYHPEDISSGDLNEYVRELRSRGYVITRNLGDKTEAELSTESVIEGQVLKVTIHRDVENVYIRYEKVEGDLNIF